MDRRRDDRRDNRDHRDSAPQRNVSYPDRGERQVTRIEKGRDSARSTAADTNDWKAERDRLQSTLVQDGVVKDYGRREDRGRHFPAVDASHLRPHVDFKNREARSNVRGRQDENTPVRPNRKPLPPLKPIDRTKRCPFLMRVFLAKNRNHEVTAYQNGAVPPESLSIYTWQDAKLKEVAELIKDSSAEAAKADTVLHFSRVYPDLKTGDWNIVEIGKTGSRLGSDDYLNLHELGFSIGDYMDVAIVPRK